MITLGLPFAEYLTLPGVHFSTLKALDVSPKHYRRAVDHGRADTDALRLGRLTHSMILTPDAPAGVAIYDGPVRRGKAWDAFAAEHAGMDIVRQEDLAAAEAMRAAVMRHPLAARLLARGEPEVTIRWETADGIPCRARADWMTPMGGLVELKTTRFPSPRSFGRECATRAYHAQVAFYEDGRDRCRGWAPGVAPSTYLIAVENVQPHDVCVYRVGGDSVEVGRRKVDEWMATLAECMASGQWPGAGGDDAIDLVLPEWAATDGLADADTSGLEEVAA